MDLAGTTEIAAARDRVWAVLTNPDALAACGPDFPPIERLDDRHARIRTRIGGGLLGGQLGIDLALDAIQPPDRVAISATGEAAGTRLSGRGEVVLSGPPAGPTSLDWQAHLELSGAFAAMGERMLEGSARPMIERGLDCLRSQLQAPASS